MSPMQVFEAGEMAVFADPTGAAFSVWRPIEHIGVEIGNVPACFRVGEAVGVISELAEHPGTEHLTKSWQGTVDVSVRVTTKSRGEMPLT